MNQTPTIHNSAKKGEIAKTVLMSGDPVRAEYIAKEYFENAKLVSDVRKICAYTGYYKGKQVSVMASGMGAGSMGIYSYELFGAYDVDQIIRVGSAGGLSEKLKIGDIVIGMASSTDSGFANQFNLPGTIAPVADYELVERAVQYGRENDINTAVGMIFSGEAFHYDKSIFERWRDMGALAVEMESAALYMNAAYFHKKCVALCTISDMMFTHEALSIEDREKKFGNMILMALSLIN